MKLAGLFSWIVLLSATTVWGQLVPEQVAIIAMAQSQESRELAGYYAKARGIPESNICLLEGKPGRTVARSAWDQQMRPAILKWLAEKGLLTKIRCLVTVWDVPLRIENQPADSSVVAARVVYLPQIRARKVKEVEGALRWLESAGASQAAAAKPPLAADASLDQMRAEFDKAFSGAYSRLQAASADEQKQIYAGLEQIAILAGGNNAALQMSAPRANTEKPTPEQVAQQALLAGRLQGLQMGSESLVMLPGTVSRDEKLIELTQAVAGRFGAIQWIDQELQLLKKNENAASFDSELSLLYWQEYPLVGWLPNPWHYSYDSNPARRATTLMVARLAAPTPEVVRRMIDDAIATEKTSLQGTVYIDARAAKTDPAKAAATGSFDQYEQSLLDLAARLKQHSKLPVVLDTKPAVFAPGACPKAALYCGWYSVGKYVDAFDWVPGAVGYHLGSYEATWLRNPNPSKTPGEKAWCPAMLEDGACATLGPVMEPYLSAFPLPDDFFSLLLTGKHTLVEVYYRTNPLLSWAMTLVGDPLYNPYRNHPILAEDALPERLRRAQPAAKTPSDTPEQAGSTAPDKATPKAPEAKPGSVVLPGTKP
ncbi:MAG: TIGR03790 family protein [Planctomycetia bacterium]|nr:TIGR03790 family protein [Planctomycetia bacterium]